MNKFIHEEKIYQFGGGLRGRTTPNRKVSNVSLPTGRGGPVRLSNEKPKPIKQGSINRSVRNLRGRRGQ